MSSFKALSHYSITLFIICVFKNVQSTNFKESVKEPISKNIAGDNNIYIKEIDITHRNKRQISSTENEHQPINLTVNFRAPKKLQLSSQNTSKIQSPLTYIMNAKPEVIPVKIPFVFKKANLKPALANYMTIKAETDENSSESTTDNILPLKTFKVIDKELPNEKVISKSIMNIPIKNKHDNYTKTPYLSQVIKLPKTLDSENLTENLTELLKENALKTKMDSKYAHDIETENKFDNVIMDYPKGTHFIHIKKLPDNIDINKLAVIKPTEESHDNITTSNQKEADINSTPKMEDIKFSNTFDTTNEYNDTISETFLNIQPAITMESRDGLKSDIITIRNDNYNKTEKKSDTLYPEVIKLDEDPSISRMSTVSKPVSVCYEDDQSVNEKYLTNLTADFLNIYNKNNCYPHASILDTHSTIVPETRQSTEVVQDVSSPKTSDIQNVIDNCPENPSVRISRTWKNKLIKINRPIVYLGKFSEYGRNYNRRNYAGMFYEIPTIYRTQDIGVFGYYNYLNKPMT